jgi:hypothetical protein
MTPHRLHTPIALCAPVPASQRSALHPLTSPPASLYPYLSSPEAGWGGLVAPAIHMVREMEGWRRPAHGAGWGQTPEAAAEAGAMGRALYTSRQHTVTEIREQLGCSPATFYRSIYPSVRADPGLATDTA